MQGQIAAPNKRKEQAPAQAGSSSYYLDDWQK
jgi:hypothetical protein